MGDADIQQAVTGDLVAEFGVQPEKLHEVYVNTGGMCSLVQLCSYLSGRTSLPQLQRDLVSHAVNEILNDPHPRSLGRRAPYSDHSIAAAAGLPSSEFDGDVLDLHRRRAPRTPAQATDAPLTDDEVADEEETRRLESLRASGLLSPSAAEGMKRLPIMAKNHFGSMSAALTLLTEHQQITPVAAGIREGAAPREDSFCDYTIRHDRTLVVTDTLRDERFRTNPFVTGHPHVRFYAGHPITGPGGQRIGALCILDDKPRTFTSSDERKLRTIAALVQLEIWVRPRRVEPQSFAPRSPTLFRSEVSSTTCHLPPVTDEAVHVIAKGLDVSALPTECRECLTLNVNNP